MNIFRHDDDPDAAALGLCDQHVIKMCLESAQILSTVARARHTHTTEALYGTTHLNHPCVKLAIEDDEALTWLAAHALALGDEYAGRFGKEHRSDAVSRRAIRVLGVDPLAWSRDAPCACVVPVALRPVADEYGHEVAYRASLVQKYHDWTEAGKPPRWTGRAGDGGIPWVPDWTARAGFGGECRVIGEVG